MANQRESRLLLAAAASLFVYAIILTLAPAVREHSWAVSYRVSHWVGFSIWAAGLFIAHRLNSRRMSDRDPYLLPLAAILSGIGLLTVWRLDPSLGLRQSIWLGVSLAAFVGVQFVPADLGFLRRYKYLLLSAGLILTALTLLFGTNPAGAGPRLWLGCCGVFLQPSEPLKLLLVIYLSAYLADRVPLRLRVFPMLVPTVFVTGLALLLLIVQRDLGTASIFILLSTAMLFLATDRRRVLVVTATALALTGLTGFFLIDVIHARLEAWLNPWNDPSGGSYQVIQSLLAVANGGILGRGPGIGNPGLVPVAHSDFIFAAIGEELGLAGTLAVLVIFGLLISRGLLASLRSPDRFQRLLSAGLTAYLGIQAFVIIGGNLRLLPLTGVTLPFVSYGGSSLLTSFVALSILAVIGNQPDKEPAPLASARPYLILAALLGGSVLAAGLADVWWAAVRSTDLLARTDNPRRSIADRYVPRGSILDRNNQPIDLTRGSSGDYERLYAYPLLAPVTGYTHPIFGQAGLESSLDDYLRGIQGNPSSLILWDGLLYGTPPPGLDVRLSIDLDLQRKADEFLGNLKGAVVLLNAQTGEVLAMASHPTYDPNQLDRIGAILPNEKDAPLVNRATQGVYPLGTAGSLFTGAPEQSEQPTEAELINLYRRLGFYTSPQLRMPMAASSSAAKLQDLKVSPIQMALAAASLSNEGVSPAPRLALAVNTPQLGWIILPTLSEPREALSTEHADQVASQLAVHNSTYWQWTGLARSGQETNTWFLAGTLPNWKATPLALVVLLEGNYPLASQRVGQQLIQAAIRP